VISSWVQDSMQLARRRLREPTIGLVRRTLLAAAAVLAIAPAATASASTVLVLEGHRVVRENDRFVPPISPGEAAAIRRFRPPLARAAGGPSVPAVLDALLASGQMTQADHDDRLQTYNDARAIRNLLKGGPAQEMTGQVNLLQGMAARGELTVSRVPVLWRQLERNAEWWVNANGVPAYGTRIRFGSSRVLWQYFPGQGLQFHPLANFGRLDGLISNNYQLNAEQFANELMKLGAYRGDALTWEYYFYFGGGSPPWTSGLSQGTALVALAEMFKRMGTPIYAELMRQAVRLFQLPPPTGVRVRTKRGATYLEYSFAPGLRIINGFLQAITGLHDAADALNDPGARALYRAGDREARYELPKYDTGYWSRYDNTPGSLSALNYHVLLRDFLVGLCRRTGAKPYCSTATKFTRYLKNGPPYPPPPPKKKRKKPRQ
jgi:hypothetical protein